MKDKEMNDIENNMKATLDQLENFSKSLTDSDVGNDDDKIFKDMGLDLESLSKLQLVPTGLFFKMHEDYELQIRPRSGLAAKHGLTVLNTPGTVDSNYRGEVKIILINLSKEDYTIKRGDRVAQGVVSYVLKQKWGKLKKVDTLDSTNRNEGGFGSTGKN